MGAGRLLGIKLGHLLYVDADALAVEEEEVDVLQRGCARVIKVGRDGFEGHLGCRLFGEAVSVPRERGASVTLVLGPMKELCPQPGGAATWLLLVLAPGPCSCHSRSYCVQGGPHTISFDPRRGTAWEGDRQGSLSPLYRRHLGSGTMVLGLAGEEPRA